MDSQKNNQFLRNYNSTQKVFYSSQASVSGNKQVYCLLKASYFLPTILITILMTEIEGALLSFVRFWRPPKPPPPPRRHNT